ITFVNVTNALNQLQAAQTALTAGDPSAAALDLAALQGSVVSRSYRGEFPLVQARENLAIARTRAQTGNFKDAILPLKSAARALDRFAQQSSARRYADLAERMRIEIDGYAERITRDHGDALDRITAWENQVSDWFNSGMPL